MCGICGMVYADREHPVNQRTLENMRDSMMHRGPDDAGLFTAPGVGLGSRRLSILDLSPRGHMPMSTRDGRYRIVYNGEIYNYPEIRDRLEAGGYTFESHTDTEVLLALYAASGSAMLHELNGMFAFAIWDAQTSTLFAARDRLGVKPFYYYVDPSGLLFASEQKALFQAGVRPEFDTSTWEELLCFRYVAGERTPFVGVQRLLPGHQLTYRRGRLRTSPWWSLSDRARELRSEPPVDPVSWFRHTFDDAVSIRRISDVPIGVLLSGGLDSSSVAASLASAAGKGVKSFTVRFDEAGFDEGDLARRVADRWELDFRELTIRPTDLLSRLRHATWLNDEPVAHASDVHLGAIAEYAKPQVTVLLSGEGADETLGGYVRYEPLKHPRLMAAARPFAAATRLAGGNPRLRKLGKFLRLDSVRDIGLFNACEVLPADLQAIGISRCPPFSYREDVWDEAASLFSGDLVRQAMFSDQRTFLCSLLDRNDRETMGASIECRVPFLDYRLVEGLAAMPSNVLVRTRDRKPLLRRALGDRLPQAILGGRKWGFGVPWSQYFRTVPALRTCVEELPHVEPIVSGPFNRFGLTKLVDTFLAGDDDGAALVRQLVMIALWYDVCCRNHQAEANRQLTTV